MSLFFAKQNKILSEGIMTDYNNDINIQKQIFGRLDLRKLKMEEKKKQSIFERLNIDIDNNGVVESYNDYGENETLNLLGFFGKINKYAKGGKYKKKLELEDAQKMLEVEFKGTDLTIEDLVQFIEYAYQNFEEALVIEDIAQDEAYPEGGFRIKYKNGNDITKIYTQATNKIENYQIDTNTGVISWDLKFSNGKSRHIRIDTAKSGMKLTGCRELTNTDSHVTKVIGIENSYYGGETVESILYNLDGSEYYRSTNESFYDEQIQELLNNFPRSTDTTTYRMYNGLYVHTVNGSQQQPSLGGEFGQTLQTRVYSDELVQNLQRYAAEEYSQLKTHSAKNVLQFMKDSGIFEHLGVCIGDIWDSTFDNKSKGNVDGITGKDIKDIRKYADAQLASVIKDCPPVFQYYENINILKNAFPKYGPKFSQEQNLPYKNVFTTLEEVFKPFAKNDEDLQRIINEIVNDAKTKPNYPQLQTGMIPDGEGVMVEFEIPNYSKEYDEKYKLKDTLIINSAIEYYNKHYTPEAVISSITSQTNSDVRTLSEIPNASKNPDLLYSFRAVSTKFHDAEALNHQLTAIEECFKEIRRCRRKSMELGPNVLNYKRDLVKIYLPFFNNNEQVAKQHVEEKFGNNLNYDDALTYAGEELSQVKKACLATIKNLLEVSNESQIEGKIRELETSYRSQVKTVFGSDVNDEEINRIIENGYGIGGFVKISALTAIQLLTASTTGGSGNFLVSGLMSAGKMVLIDSGLETVNELSSENGFNLDKFLATERGTTQFALLGSFVAGPIASKIAGGIGAKYAKAGLNKAFKQSPTLTGKEFYTACSGGKLASLSEHLVRFTSDVLIFGGYEYVTGDTDFIEALKGMGTFQVKMTVINHFLQMTVGRHFSPANVEAIKKQKQLKEAIDKYGENFTVREITVNGNTQYEVSFGNVKKIVSTSAEASSFMLETVMQKPEIMELMRQLQKMAQEEDKKSGKDNSNLLEKTWNSIKDLAKDLKSGKTKPNNNNSDENQVKTKPKDNPALVQQATEEVQSLRKSYETDEKELKRIMTDAGFDEIGEFSSRIKSESSLKDKVLNYLEDNPRATIEEALSDIRDAFGGRTRVAPGDFKSHPEVQELLAKGDEKGALQKAAELQSQPAVEKIKGMIDKIASGEANFEITRITNYVSKEGVPYFSEAQLSELSHYAVMKGVKGFDQVIRIENSGDNAGRAVSGKGKLVTKHQASGYTALQMNIRTKDGKIMEWQYRGETVDEFAEAEHVPYDLRTNKNIKGDHPELAVLYDSIEDLIKGFENEVFSEYNRYLDDYYTHLRRVELGFESIEPKLSDYGKLENLLKHTNNPEIQAKLKEKYPNGIEFDARLEANNLIALSKTAKRLKDGKITEQQAVEEYQKKLNVNNHN